MNTAPNPVLDSLPPFRLPMLGKVGGTFRAFEVAGDAMLPIASGTTIVGRYVEDWQTIKGGTPCIVVSRNRIAFRRLYPLKDGFCLLHDHPATTPTSERAQVTVFDEILEIWEAKSYIGNYLTPGNMTLERLSALVADLTQQVKTYIPKLMPTTQPNPDTHCTSCGEVLSIYSHCWRCHYPPMDPKQEAITQTTTQAPAPHVH